MPSGLPADQAPHANEYIGRLWYEDVGSIGTADSFGSSIPYSQGRFRLYYDILTWWAASHGIKGHRDRRYTALPASQAAGPDQIRHAMADFQGKRIVSE